MQEKFQIVLLNNEIVTEFSHFFTKILTLLYEIVRMNLLLFLKYDSLCRQNSNLSLFSLSKRKICFIYVFADERFVF